MNSRSTQKPIKRTVFFKHTLIVLTALLALSTCFYISGFLQPVEAQDADTAPPDVVRNGGLEMGVKAGYGKIAISSFSGSWVPFRITIANRGEPVTGRLIVRTESPPSPNAQVREYAKQIQLPTGSHQLHEIAAFINSNHKDTEVLVVADGSEVIKTTVKVDRVSWSNDELRMGVVDTDQTALNNISSVEIARPQNRQLFKASAQPNTSNANSSTPGTQAATQPNVAQNTNPPGPAAVRRRNVFGSNQKGPKVQPVVLSFEDLPLDYVSYDCLDALVLGDAPLGQISESQARAIKNWLASGGFLIVTGGADFAGLRASGLDSLLPVNTNGASTTASLVELTTAYGRFESSEPALVMSATARQGARTLLGSPDRVIVGEKDYGSGTVRFVAINPKLNPYRGWGAAKDLWTDLLIPAAEAVPGQRNWFTRGRRGGRSDIQDFLFSLAEIKPPSAKYFILFLLAYVFTVGPLNYLALRWMKKLDWAWVTIPAVVILFTVTSVVVAQVRRGGSSIATDVSVVELHQRDQLARAINWMMIMPSYKGDQQINIDGHDTFATDMADGFGSRATTSGSIEIERNPQGFALSVPMNTWSSGQFKFRSISEISLPIVSASDSSGAVVSVKNLSNAPITGAVYISASGISDPFDIAPGEEKQITLNGPQQLTFSEWYAGKLASDRNERELFESLASTLDQEIGGQEVFREGFFDNSDLSTTLSRLERPLIIGFMDEPSIPISFGGSINRRSKSLYVVHL